MSEPIILAEREIISMSATSTQYLTLRRSGNLLQIFTGGYEGLGLREKFYNEETEDYELPLEIDGKKVVGIDDEVVFGGDLDFYNPEDVVEFNPGETEIWMNWLQRSGWRSFVSDETIIFAITKITRHD